MFSQDVWTRLADQASYIGEDDVIIDHLTRLLFHYYSNPLA